jgi:pimeloyl-ACP methyl ester carboxylesterase
MKNKGSYAEVNGLNMYYEVHGNGKPLVLLHGSFMTISLNFGKMIPDFARDRKVIAIEQQGHGHTEDIDRPVSYDQMADDTAELLRQLEIEKADILGYSLGGGIAIELAIRHPDRVDKLVVISAVYKRDGWYPEYYPTMRSLTPEMMIGSGLQEEYAEVAPNPDNWAKLVTKFKKLGVEFIGRTSEEFQSIKAPTLIMIGDSDSVPPEKAVEMFKLLGGGVFGDIVGLPSSQLAIIPGTTHAGIMERADWWIPMIKEFLDKPIDL